MSWDLDDSARNYPWRVGRKLGRTVYAQSGGGPSDDDELLALMETKEIAEHVVDLHNAFLNDDRPGFGELTDGTPIHKDSYRRGVHDGQRSASQSNAIAAPNEAGQGVHTDGSGADG